MTACLKSCMTWLSGFLGGMLACLSALIPAAQCLKTLIKCGLKQTLLPLDGINSQLLPVSAKECSVDQGRVSCIDVVHAMSCADSMCKLTKLFTSCIVKGNCCQLMKLKSGFFHPPYILLQSVLATLVCSCHNDGLLTGINEQQSEDSMLRQLCANNSKNGSARLAKQCCQVAKITIPFVPFVLSAKQLSRSASWFSTVLRGITSFCFLPLQPFHRSVAHALYYTCLLGFLWFFWCCTSVRFTVYLYVQHTLVNSQDICIAT